MKKKLILLILILWGSQMAYPQGCIPVRNLVGFGQFATPEYNSLDAEPVKWLVNVNSRYYSFSQTYNGTSKVYESPADIKTNNTFVMNFSVTRLLEKGWSYTIDVPFMAADRTTWQEHDPTTKIKHKTSSFGLGDIRVTAYKWLFDVSIPHKGNIQVGLGLKLPTGDYRYQDYFYKPGPVAGTSVKVMAPVSFILQPGDGGTGINTEVNSFYTLNKTVTLYGNAFYLFNPRDQNGTSSTTGKVLDPTKPADANLIASGGTVNSVSDSYTARAGANFTFKNLTLWGGARVEGSPVHDIIGASNGLRRAGLIISTEPGLNYKLKKSMLYMFMPVPIYKTTYQIVPDQILDQLDPSTKHPTTGGFAKVLFFVGAMFKL